VLPPPPLFSRPSPDVHDFLTQHSPNHRTFPRGDHPSPSRRLWSSVPSFKRLCPPVFSSGIPRQNLLVFPSTFFFFCSTGRCPPFFPVPSGIPMALPPYFRSIPRTPLFLLCSCAFPSNSALPFPPFIIFFPSPLGVRSRSPFPFLTIWNSLPMLSLGQVLSLIHGLKASTP